MKNRLIYIILSALCMLSPSLMAEDCEDHFVVIQKLHDAKKWKETKVECKSYLRNCGSRAQVVQILNDCDRHVRPPKREKPRPIDPNPDVVDYKRFSVDKETVEFAQPGGQAKILVTADSSWDIYEYPGWISVSRDGDVLTIETDENYNLSAREDDVILMDERQKEVRITVFQERCRDYLHLGANLINNQTGLESTYTITVNSNKSWQVNNNLSWCKIETNKNQITVIVDRNNDGYDRKGEIEVTALSNSTNVRSIISVRQVRLQNYLILSHTSFFDNVGKGCKSLPIKVETDNGYFRIEDVPAWVEIEDENNTSFVVSILENKGGDARTAQMKVVAGNQSKTFTVSQVARKYYVNVYPDAIRLIQQQGGTPAYQVETNYDSWHVVNLPDWCVLEEETNESFKLNIQPNDGGPRSATFSVSAHGERCNLTIQQK